MPTYHFNLADCAPSPDDEGTELSDLQSAQRQAVIFVASYLRDQPDLVLTGHEFRVDVTDDAGKLLFGVVVVTTKPMD